MAIEPIKGFYVHDEVTDTDGVAKYDYDALENSPDVDGYVEQLANGEDVYETTQFDNCVMGDVHSVGHDIYNPVSSTNTAYYPEYFDNTFRVYFDDTTYKVMIAGYNDDKVYVNKVNPVTTSPATIDKLSVAGLKDCPWFAIEIRHQDNSTLNIAEVNNAGIYVETFLTTNKNNARFLMQTSDVTDLRLNNINYLDFGFFDNQSGVSDSLNGYEIEGGGYLFPYVYLTELPETAFLFFSSNFQGDLYWAWSTGTLSGAISPYNKFKKRDNVFYAEINKTTAPANALSLQVRIDNRDYETTMSVSKIVLSKGVYTSFSTNEKTIYVSPTGSDSNDGLTRETALLTIQKAINSGAKKILIKEGTYNAGFSMIGKHGVSLELDRHYNVFQAGTNEENPKVIINSIVTVGANISNCYDCNYESIEIKNCTSQGWRIDKCSGLVFRDCLADNIGIGATSGGGFVITHVNADFYNCGAYNIGTTTASTDPTYHLDGFNIHETGTTNFINCWAYNCLDDGISHHDACYGYIDGGEWYGCGKGGVASPTHGAKVDIRNVYSHDNGFGIYAQTDHNVQTLRPAINIANCVCKNNRTKDISVENTYYTANVWNCIYDTSEGFTELT